MPTVLRRSHTVLVAILITSSVVAWRSTVAQVNGDDPAERLAKRQVLIKLSQSALDGDLFESSLSIEDPSLPENVSDLLGEWGIKTVELAFPNASPSDTVSVLSDGRIYTHKTHRNLVVVTVPEGKEPGALVDQLTTMPSVEFAESNYLPREIRGRFMSGSTGGRRTGNLRESTVRTGPNDTYYSTYQWNMKNSAQGGYDIAAEGAWAVTPGSESLNAAVIDYYGVYVGHDDFEYDGDSRAIDSDYGGYAYSVSHGTAVAGILGATGNDSYGVAGVDWRSTIVNEYISGYTVTGMINRINDAVGDYDARVIVFSGGIGTWSNAILNSIRDAFSAGVLFCAAGPEDGSNHYLNRISSLIMSVGAVDRTGGIPSYIGEDDWDEFLDVSAPGGDDETETDYILSTINAVGGGFQTPHGYFLGTSAANPHVGGTAMLLLSRDPTLQAFDLEAIIKLSATPVGNWEDRGYFGAGLLNAEEALESITPPRRVKRFVGGLNSMGYKYVTFSSSPNGYCYINQLPSGTYYVEQYQLSATGTWEGPINDIEAWPSLRGYSDDESSNDPASYDYSWVELVTSPYGASAHTYFYHILNGPTGPENMWVPFDPRVGGDAEETVSAIGSFKPSAPTISYAGWEEYGEGMAAHLIWSRNPDMEGVFRYDVERKEVPDEGPEGDWEHVLYVSQPSSGSTASTWEEGPRDLEGLIALRYRVSAESSAGDSPWSNAVYVEIEGPGGPEGSAASESGEAMPRELQLGANYPNPFNPSTQIRFGLSRATHVRLQILNIRGQVVRTLVDDERAPGWYTVTWDGKNSSGREAASGIYLYLIEAEGKRLLKRMMLMR